MTINRARREVRMHGRDFALSSLEFDLLTALVAAPGRVFSRRQLLANLYELAYGEKAAKLTESLTEIMPGRPTVLEHRHAADEVRRHYDKALRRSAVPSATC
jgi:hypothetical protein